MFPDKAIRLLFFFVIATIPLVFGARHPLVHGSYSSLLLLTSGTWLLVNSEHLKKQLASFHSIVPVVIILCIFATTMPLPLAAVSFLSPVRAGYLHSGTDVAGLENMVTSLSYYAPGSMFYAVYGLALYFFFQSSSPLLLSERFLHKTLWLITIVGTAEALYGLLQAINPSIGVLWLSGDLVTTGCAKGSIIYRNQYAALLNICWPMSLALGTWLYKPVYEHHAIRRNKKGKRSFADQTILLFQMAAVPYLCAGVMMLAVVFSRSRGGILVMISTAALFIGLLPLSKKSRVLAASSLVLFVFVYGGIIGFGDIAERFTFFYQSAVFRLELWSSSLTMLRDHFLTGIGMGSYEFLSPAYLKNVPDNVWFDRAHNEYIELVIELGIPVMVLFLVWMLTGMARYGLKLKKNRKNKTLVQFQIHDFAAVGAFSGLVGFMMHATVDFVWRLPATIVYAVSLLAILHAWRQRSRRKKIRNAPNVA